MWNRRNKIIVACVCALALIAGGVLFYVLHDRSDVKDTVKIPEVPEGSVLVWCLTEEYDVNENGNERLMFSGKFDDTGRCVSAKHNVYSEVVPEVEKVTYEYDPATHCVTEVIRSDTLNVYEVIGSDGKSKKMRYQSVNETGALTGGMMYEFDEKGRFVAETFYGEKGEAESKRTHAYDMYDHEISRIRYDLKTGEEQVVRRAELDELGRAVRVYELNTETLNEVLMLEVEYAADGSRTERSFTLFDETGIPRIREYNANGELITEIIYSEYESGDSQTEKNVMEYVDGREVKKSEYDDDELSEVTETVYEQDDHSVTVTTTRTYTNVYGIEIQNTKIETCRLHGDSRPEDEKYDSREIRTVIREDGSVISETVVLYEFTYDEYGNRTAYKKTKTVDGETRYCHGGRYVYTPVVITKEQAAENAAFYDRYYHQVMDEVGMKDQVEDMYWWE